MAARALSVCEHELDRERVREPVEKGALEVRVDGLHGGPLRQVGEPDHGHEAEGVPSEVSCG